MRRAVVSSWRSRLFLVGCAIGLVAVVVLILSLLIADVSYVRWEDVQGLLADNDVLASLYLTLITSGITVCIGLALAIPSGYILSRCHFPGHAVIDSLIDLPIILPPLIIGLSLLVFFQTDIGSLIEEHWTFVYDVRGIILCQLIAGTSFGIRSITLAFNGVDERLEHVALTLGCDRLQAFLRVSLPLARNGIVTGGILIWTRAIGIYGPLAILVGIVRNKTEVLSTTIYLEQSVGHDGTALAVALGMVIMTIIALVSIRLLGGRPCVEA